MPNTPEFVDFYEVLGVPETADETAIKAKIREHRRMWNKRAGQSDPVKRAVAEERIRNLAEAERVLLTPGERKRFDAEKRNHRSDPTPSASPSGGTRNWGELARQHLAQGDAHAANYAAREAITANGADHEAWSIRANTSFAMGNYRDAEYEFLETIRLQPNNAEYHFDLGEAYAGLQEWDRALERYEQALRIDPGNPMYRTAIANVYLQNDLPDKARELMEDVVKEHPDIPVFQYYLALALHLVALSSWSRLANGGSAITSPRQVETTKKLCDRALSLKFEDDALRNSLREMLSVARSAQEEKFFHGNFKGYGIALFIGLVFIPVDAAGAIFGVLLIMATLALYVYRHRMPVWQHNAKSPGIVKQGV